MTDPETDRDRPPTYRTARELRDQRERPSRVLDGVRNEYKHPPGCRASECPESADAVTPAGPLCDDHADELATDLANREGDL